MKNFFQSIFRFLAPLILIAWGGAFHHDVWLGLFDLTHHHDHHGSTGHSHHSGEDSDSNSPAEHDESVPLPNTHIPAQLSCAKNALELSKAIADPISGEFLAEGMPRHDFTPRQRPELPPPMKGEKQVDQLALFLAHCVQSNAPPFLS